MSWNYRFVHIQPDGEDQYAIMEVYYNEDGIPCCYGDPYLFVDDPKDIPRFIKWLIEAGDKQILEDTDEETDFIGDLFDEEDK